jgi:serine/threonine-protein kinase
VLALETVEPTTDESPPPRRPSEPLVPGERYELGDTIARGGMGEVISAHDADIGREVAIKRLRAPNPTPLALARFLREARIQGRLDHPAIVPVHELAYDREGRPYFAMKKLSGTTLAAIIASPEPGFTRQQLLRAFADVCLALEFAHTRGVIHRDIKPANILLGDFGEVYVLDWGIARVPTDRTEDEVTGEFSEDGETGVVSWASTNPGSAMGTPGYMSPEQARGEIVDARADVYALGCVLYEILAKLPLHPRGKPGIRSALRGVDARPSRHDSSVPPELDALCVRATTPLVEDRIASARELAESLNRYLDGDRDMALRNRLAREHLASALDAAEDEEGRAIAMREAGQAIALDPTLTPAAELIGRLMLEPPKRVPPQVHEELKELDRTTTRRFTQNAIGMHVSTFVTLPIVWALGIHDSLYMWLFGIGSAVGLAFALYELRTKCDLFWVHAIVLCYGMALMARVMTPYVIAPTMVAVNAVAMAFHPRGRDRRQFAVFLVIAIAAVMCVWAAEQLGWISPTLIFIEGGIFIRSPIAGIDHFPVEIALGIWIPFATVMSSLTAYSTARVATRARERAHLQAWQVRQLVPNRRD